MLKYLFIGLLLASFSYGSPEGDCTYCKYIVGAVERWVDTNHTEVEATALLESLCTLVPAFDQVCVLLVGDGVDEMVDWLNANEDPASVCTMLDFCETEVPSDEISAQEEDNDSVSAEEKSKSEVSYYVEPPIETSEPISADSYYLEPPAETAAPKPEDSYYLEPPAETTTAKPEDSYYLEPPAETSAPIVSVPFEAPATTSGDSESSSQVEPPNPEHLEAFAKLISLHVENFLIKKKRSDLQLRDTRCFVCEQMMDTFEAWIASESNTEQIILMLDEICEDMINFEGGCEAILSYGVPSVIHYLQKTQNGSKVCADIGLCQIPNLKKKEKTEKKKLLKHQSSGECDACSTLISAMESWVNEKQSMTTIEVYLEDILCIWVPDFEGPCSGIVEIGTPQVISWIQTHENPQTVCYQMGFCPY